jgi:hypothetical protein
LKSLAGSYQGVLDQAASLGLADAAKNAGAPLEQSFGSAFGRARGVSARRAS